MSAVTRVLYTQRMKKLLVLGASGLTGHHIVAEALAQGYEVTAFVRSPDKLTARGDRLHVATGNTVDDPASVMRAMDGQDVVISAIGAGKSFKAAGLIERSMRNVVAAMEAEGVRRLIWTSAFGVGDTRRDTPLLPKIFMSTLLRGIYADKRASENFLRQRNLDWTLVCPTGLSNAPGNGRYHAAERLDLRGVFPTVPRADVAKFIVTQIEDRTYLNKEVLVSS
jgi:putative NADH-flavin reductase